MANLNTKFHTPGSSGSLVTAIKLNAEEKYCMAAKLLFYIVCNSYTCC
jgi:hypothetical protein